MLAGYVSFGEDYVTLGTKLLLVSQLEYCVLWNIQSIHRLMLFDLILDFYHPLSSRGGNVMITQHWLSDARFVLADIQLKRCLWNNYYTTCYMHTHGCASRWLSLLVCMFMTTQIYNWNKHIVELRKWSTRKKKNSHWPLRASVKITKKSQTWYV